jgi:hypothetical protein
LAFSALRNQRHFAGVGFMTGRIRAYGLVALLTAGCASANESPNGIGEDQTADASADADASAGPANGVHPGASHGGAGVFVPGLSSGSSSSGGAVDATTDSTIESGAESGPTCGYDAGTAPSGPPKCGDGFRDPATEECDDGLGTSTAHRRGCSAGCQVIDELAVAPEVAPDGGFVDSPRTLGAGRHPLAVSDSSYAVAYLSPFSSPLALSLATFNPKGVSTSTVTPLSVQSTVVDNSNPVVAGLPCGQYAAAWADFGGDGDELGVALRLVQPGATPTGAPGFANTTTTASQYDPDILALSSGEVVVAWVDDSDPTTGPDLRWRSFDDSLHPTSAEQTLAATADSEADVALAALGASGWAAAWRDDSAGLETIRVHAGSADWTIGPAFLPAPAATKPALTAIDGTHLVVAYAVGIDSTDSGVANDSVLQVALLDTTAPGMVSGTPVAGTLSTQSQSQPALATVQGQLFVSWWTAAAQGDPLGEENWLKPLTVTGTTIETNRPEVALPRWSQAQRGDQRAPAIAASTLLPGGALVTAWDDLGRGVLSGEGAGDVVVEVVPVPVVRTGAQTCPSGWTECNGNTEYGCETSLTQASHCGSCTNACPAGAQCAVSGGNYSCITCSASAPLLCGTTCVDPTTNPNDCGGCGNVCPASPVTNSIPTCNAGTCGWACFGNRTACPVNAPTDCFDLQTDWNNCGQCGHVCDYPDTAFPSCSAGVCGWKCIQGSTACPTSAPTECDYLPFDVNNCGSCGNVCPSGPSGSITTCNGGQCGWSCTSQFTLCNGACLPIPDPTEGVFAAPGGPTTSCGTPSAPCGTIAAALNAAGATGKVIIYLASGTYVETVVVPFSATLKGGWVYSGGSSWQPVCSANPASATIIKGTQNAGLPSAGVIVTAGAPTLDTLTVLSPDTAGPGESLYGIFAANAGTVTLTNVVVQAKAGGSGVNSAQGTTGAAPPTMCTAASGDAGAGGTAGTPGPPGPGAAAGTWGANGYVPTAAPPAVGT